ncbi:type II secretion system F family protein [Actinomyces sp. B33]|uniref:type II secretion system F family protein n=1 Tax=Actinomyces sp. B33 TaxID=2942131 RepID=UPI0023417FDE|nr:type II secretion system F family protein [Actinomyces sp. B33]MDC4233799.1 type II secretion system F family protein [Actinomyces sp. B33]
MTHVLSAAGPVLAGLLFSAGLLLLVGAATARRPDLAARVAQGSVRPRGARPTARMRGAWFGALLEGLGSTTGSVERRLELLGAPTDPGPFRLRQAIGAIAAAALIVALVTPVLAHRGLAGLPAIGLAGVVGALTGLSAADRLLTIRARRRQRSIDSQTPDASELLALAIGAGESIPAALSRVARIASTDLAVELGRAVADMRSGTPSIVALADLSRRNDSPALDRLCLTLITSIERGAPLARVLHDQARDIREASRQDLMEEGGKREIAMLFPVIFLILPVTVLFALYPGLIALDLAP